MAWIKMRTNLREDPAVISISTNLGIDPDLVVGKLHRLWSWADGQTTDGRIKGVTAEWLDRFLEQKNFSKQLQKARWLRVTRVGITLPNFDHHNGKSAKKRIANTLRQSTYRENKQAKPGATEARQKRDKGATKTLYREEKRREEQASQPEAAAGVAKALVEAGVKRKDVRVELAAIDGITPARVRLCVAKAANTRVKSQAGLLVCLLRDRDWDLPKFGSAFEACTAFRDGLWSSCNGVAFSSDTIGHNGSGLCLNGKVVVKTKDLGKAVFE